ncbi:MAG: PD-(D/E)XK nuclease family protein [Bacteroidales bacterium]|nr:PD-(D/E)XK nuclease family protein [Bacteroidales bacterium]
MLSFLEEVADHIFEKYPSDTGEICLVTPNRRAGLFLRKHFSKKVKQPTWSPAFLSIEDFVNRISGLQVADNLSLMFHFYEVYQSIEGERSESVDDFLRWGSVLLRDFDEIDAALEKPEELFAYLKDLKSIETWNPDGKELTEFQQNYLDFFNKFSQYHQALRSYLGEKNMAYQGMSYRKAADNLKQNPDILPWKKVIFAGFNALNQAEESIIDTLKKAGLAEVISDSDPYYEDNPRHEAGHFIRKYRKKWDIPFGEKKDSLFSNPKKVKVLGIARNVNQAQLAGNILDVNAGLPLNEQTALVLANENLLIPVLNALPERARAINITMGYPLAKTSLHGFFEALLQLHLTADRLNAAHNGQPPAFYYKDLLRFFSNTCSALLYDPVTGQQKLDKLLRAISQSNRTFYRFDDLLTLTEASEDFAGSFHFLSENWPNEINLVIPALREISLRLDSAFRQKGGESFDSLQKSPFFIDFEALYYYGRILSRIESVLTGSQSIQSIRTLWLIIKQTVAETRLAFSGEPVEGLQVMGMLETRNLDFKNIILISANEDVIPKGKSGNSFIPFEVKRKFGLQVHSDKDAVYAYHFYRLLQRAENVYLIYNTESGGMGSSEQSRFITQLQHELPDFNPTTELSSELVSLSPAIKTGKEGISIIKDEEIMARLEQMGSFGLSPSALNTFIRCPLKFYLEKVARLREAEEVEETIEASTMGNVVHGVLEDLYSSFKKQVISPEMVSAMQDKVHELTIRRFSEHYPEGDINSGKNLLLFSLAKRQIENFLKWEHSRLQEAQQQGQLLTLIDTEAKLSGSIRVEVAGKIAEVKISGKTDRIDKLGSTVRVIDYKTGKVDERALRIKVFDQLIEDVKYEKAFQVLAYTWLYQHENPEETNVESGIFSMRNLKSGFLKSEVDPKGPDAGLDPINEFGRLLQTLAERIMDPSEVFSQTEKQENCKFCPFQALCGRFES